MWSSQARDEHEPERGGEKEPGEPVADNVSEHEDLHGSPTLKADLPKAGATLWSAVRKHGRCVPERQVRNFG